MPSTMKRKRRRRRSRKAYPRIAAILMALLLAAAAFVIEYHGGQGAIPTWSDLYTAFGVPMEGPDAEVLAGSATTVTVLDVGQGDSVLIGQDGKYCLIDTGTADSRDTLVRGLRQAGVTELQYLILTHPHADHTGGALAVLENLQVDELLLPVWETDSDADSPWPRGLLEQAADAGTVVTETAEGDRYMLGSGTLQVLQGGSQWMEDANDANNGSLCLMFEAGAFRYLATGDAEGPAEEALVQRYGTDLHATVYKAGHHGSSTSSGEELLSVVRPQAAAISCGVDNEYGHPNAATLRRLQDAGAEIYRTDTMGTITFTYEDGVLTVVTSDDALDAAA
ncbi:MAG: ComEC/Rec2 family competence protein [Gemmiger sp.]